MPTQFFVVDALNICKEGPLRKANLSILLSLLLELTKKGHDFLCIFDESAFAEFTQQGLPAIDIYNSLFRDCYAHFSKARGAADKKIVGVADEKHCPIISNDNFRNLRRDYPWLTDPHRLVKVSVVSGIIFPEELGVQANVITNLEAVWNELKSNLALRASRPGSKVRTSPAKPTQGPSVVVPPKIEEGTSRKAMPTRGDDIIEQLVDSGFLTPDIAHILQHGIDEQVSVVSTRKNDMVAIVLVVDKSGSMQKWQSDIIDGHKLMIQGLLGAHPRFDLRFGQILFNHEVEYFQPICEFRDKSDPKRASSDVKLLDTQNYKPNGFTALYDAILKGICALAPIFYRSQEIGFALNSQVCIMTDGIDEGIDGHAGSKIPPQQLGQAIRYMLGANPLGANLVTNIILAGIGNYDYRNVGKNLGIDRVIQIPTTTSAKDLERAQKQIRATFELFSRTQA